MPFNAGSVRGDLELDVSEFVGALKRASASLDRLDRNTEQTARGFSAFRRSLALARDAVIVLGPAFRAAQSAVRALARGLSSVIQTSAAFEQLEIRLRTLLGSQQEANKAIENFVNLSARTPFSVKQIVEGAATLSSAALGNREQLELLTKTAANLAAVTGLSFQEASSNLQRALAGGIGAADLFRERGVRALVESIQEIPDLTKVSLDELEQAFVDTFGPNGTLGTSAADLANTLGGALSNVDDAFTNLKDAIGDALAPGVISGAREAIIPALERLRDVVKENEEEIRNVAAILLERAVGAAVAFGEASLNLTLVLVRTKEAALAVAAAIAQAALAFFKFTPAGRAIDLVTGSIQELETFLKGLEQEAVSTAEGSQQLVASLEKLRPQLQAAGSVGQQLAESLRNSSSAQDKLNESISRGIKVQNEATKALQDRLQHLREITGVSFEAAEASDGIAAGTAAAARNTAQLANAARDASSSLSSAAGSAAQAASATAGAASNLTAGASRRSGGSLGLNFDTPQEGVAQLQQLRRRASQVSPQFGLRRQAGNFVRQFAARVNSAIDQQMADFTSSVLDELNRAGIFDPQRRSQIVQQRVDEARRLGILATRSII